jgi:hypothetical protein
MLDIQMVSTSKGQPQTTKAADGFDEKASGLLTTSNFEER